MRIELRGPELVAGVMVVKVSVYRGEDYVDGAYGSWPDVVAWLQAMGYERA